MIVLSVLIYLPKKIILIIGILLVAGHNMLDTVHVAGTGAGDFAWSLLHEPKFFVYGGEKFFIAYPILPWIGIIALGYSLGNLYSPGYSFQQRRKLLLQLGAGAIILFLGIRFTNLYGDLLPWIKQPEPAFTVLSFINVTKYPPSLLYALMTLGPGLIFLALAERKPGKGGRFFLVYRRTHMFFYILHVFLIHLLAMFATTICGFKWSDMIWIELTGNDKLTGYGFPLVVVYGVWIFIVHSLYPLCKWYDRYKSSHREKWWLSYL